jgi:3'(2'),5'-bisphosphate nucleotidase
MSQEMGLNLGPSGWTFDSVAEVFANLAVEAGAAIMRLYGTDAHTRAKPDHSPVCDADLAAEAIILKGLAAALPQFAVVSEEAVAAGAKLSEHATFILVDPLDGTREFLSRNGEFTVNLALIIDAVPRAGVVYAPAAGRIWIAGLHAAMTLVPPGGKLPPGEKRQALRVRGAPDDGLVALASRSHADARTESFLAQLPVKERQPAGSSLKFCRIAEGAADVYPRFGPTMEWDTAAGDAVLRSAGGIVCDPAGGPLRYGKFADRLTNGPFVAWGDPAAAAIYAGAKTA